MTREFESRELPFRAQIGPLFWSHSIASKQSGKLGSTWRIRSASVPTTKSKLARNNGEM
jgi:hypothetical protein